MDRCGDHALGNQELAFTTTKLPSGRVLNRPSTEINPHNQWYYTHLDYQDDLDWVIFPKIYLNSDGLVLEAQPAQETV